MYCKRNFTLILFSCITIFVFGCSSDDNSTDPGGGTPPPETNVGPEGDTLEITGQLMLIIPPGALTDTLAFTITQNGSPAPAPGSMGFVSNCYTIGPVGTDFDIPATLIISYSESNLGGADESSIDIYTNDGGGWDILPTTVNVAQNQITTQISHLSDFAGMADTTSAVTEGIFVRFVVGRNITYMGSGDPIRIDGFEAVIDSTYAPCDPINPIGTALVKCNDDTLAWNEDVGFYMYPEIPSPMDLIITLGETYTFEIAAGPVPALTSTITFPGNEPYITYPTYMSTPSWDGFDITWEGSGSGVVELIFMDGEGQQILFEETANDGSYSITASDLSGLQSGTFSIMLNHYNRETITAAGYDSRSFIAARVQSQTVFQMPEK